MKRKKVKLNTTKNVVTFLKGNKWCAELVPEYLKLIQLLLTVPGLTLLVPGKNRCLCENNRPNFTVLLGFGKMLIKTKNYFFQFSHNEIRSFITYYKFIWIISPAMRIVKRYEARADISALALLASVAGADISALALLASVAGADISALALLASVAGADISALGTKRVNLHK